MSEAEWRTSSNVPEMLGWLAWGMQPARKWNLFSLACIEPIRSHLSDPRLTAALDVLAKHAEGECDFQELLNASQNADAAMEAILDDPSEQRWFYIQLAAAEAVAFATNPVNMEDDFAVPARCATVLAWSAEPKYEATVRQQANSQHVALVHEIFGNPFRPVELDPLWLTFDVQTLASGIYDAQAFDRMPILADALQDADCDNSDVLSHCRDLHAGHVRGCWVLDLLLRK